MTRFERQQLRAEARTLASAARAVAADIEDERIQSAIRALVSATEKLANVIESIDNEPKPSAGLFDRRFP